jgi:hypothetical protein
LDESDPRPESPAALIHEVVMPVEFPAVSPLPPEQLEPIELASAKGSLRPVPHVLPKPSHRAVARVHLPKPKALRAPKVKALKVKATAHVSKKAAAVLIPAATAAAAAAKVKAPASKAVTSAATAALRPSANSLKTMIQREAVHVTGSVIQRAITTGVTTKEKQALTPPKATPAPSPQSGAPQPLQPTPPAR